MRKRNIVITITIIVAVIIGVGSIALYTNINNSNKLEEFKKYIGEYNSEMSNYIITQHKEKYNEVISKTEQILKNKESENIENLKSELVLLKEDIVKSNLELVNASISELEGIDIDKIEDKELVKEKIDEIKILRDDSNFVKANEAAIELKDGIKKQLEAIKLEEEKKKAEEEAKRLEEEKKKAEEEARKLEADNKEVEEENIFDKKKAVDILVKNQPFYAKFDINEKNGEFSFAKNGTDIIWILLWEQQYDNDKKLKYYSYRLKDVKMHEEGGTGTIENGYIYEDGTIGY